MGQKINPIGLRIGVTKTWDSKWFNEKNYASFVREDYKIRKHIKTKLHYGAISKIRIERSGERIMITIHTAKAGVIIGKKGSEVDMLKQEVAEMTEKEVYISTVEITAPELDAQLISEAIVGQIEKRVSYRRAMKKAITSAVNGGAKGVKVMVGGRLDGAEIARTTWERVGKIPNHTIRADIDYGFAEAYTTYGRVGVKVWIYKGDILGKSEEKQLIEIEKVVKKMEEENAGALQDNSPYVKPGSLKKEDVASKEG